MLFLRYTLHLLLAIIVPATESFKSILLSRHDTRVMRSYGAYEMEPSLNLIGSPLQPCSYMPMTGFFRDGFCNTCGSDSGSHTVCCRVTTDFLTYSKRMGNDLSTPMPEYGFPGLKSGDAWCLCASRWSQAAKAGCAPQVLVVATHAKAADICGLQELLEHATEIPRAEDEMQ